MAGKEAVNPTDYDLEDAEDHIGYLIGATDILGEAHAMTDSTDQPDVPTTGQTRFSFSGHDKYVSSADSNYYNTGRMCLTASNSLNFSTAMQSIPGLSAFLSVGTYHIFGQVLISVPATAGQGALHYQVAGSGGLTASAGRFLFRELFAAGGVNGDFTTTPPLSVDITGSTPGGGGEDRTVLVDGIVVVSVAGTIDLQMKQTATAAVNSVQFGTYWEVMPVT